MAAGRERCWPAAAAAMPSWFAWPLTVMTSSPPVRRSRERWPGLPGSTSASSRSGRLAARPAPLPARAGPRLSGLGAGGCPGVGRVAGASKISGANELWESSGSNGGQAPDDAGQAGRYFLASTRSSQPSAGNRRTSGRGQNRLARVSPRPVCCWPTSPSSRSRN